MLCGCSAQDSGQLPKKRNQNVVNVHLREFQVMNPRESHIRCGCVILQVEITHTPEITAYPSVTTYPLPGHV